MPAPEWLGPAPPTPARRVVSLVPSLTDAVYRLGAGACLVARTRFCIRPRGRVETVATIRGPKNPDRDRIRALAPDLILANREENTRDHVLDLARTIPVCLTDPAGPADVPALWRTLGRALGRDRAGAAWADRTRAAIAAARGGAGTRPRFLYLIWKQPWMAAGHGTYISNLLETAGLANALAPDLTRYPQLDSGALAAIDADLVLFSSEPYAFRLPRDLGPLAGGAVGCTARRYRLADGAIARLVDGESLSWYPSLTIEGLRYASALRRSATTRS
ncbi:MAG: helical backbone metal receptor [Planctomycetota bacterium]|nr:helical backbone metal receptor [Planctomycetota bacterium]